MTILNGTEYTNAMFTGLGYKDLFPDPVFSDLLAELDDRLADITALRDETEGFRDESEDFRDEAQAAAVAAAAAASDLQATSVSSISIGSGAKSATISTGKVFIPGMPLRFAYTTTPTNFFIAITNTYNSGTGAWTGTVGTDDGTDYDDPDGAGPYTAWTISFGGWEGAAGADGDDAWAAPVSVSGGGTYTPAAGLTKGVSLIIDPTAGHTTVDLVNSPPGLRIAHVQNGAIGDNNMIKVKPPAGKNIYNQANDDIITRATQFPVWEIVKDSNGNYA